MTRVVAIVLVLFTSTVLAQDDEAARAFFDAGTRLYGEGEFVEAARQYELAYERSGRPQMLYNIYLAYRDAGDQQRALDALSRYLDEASEIENRRFLEARRDSLRAERSSDPDPDPDPERDPLPELKRNHLELVQ